VIDSLQLTANHKVATPAQWKQGEEVIIAGSVSDKEAKENSAGRGSGGGLPLMSRSMANRAVISGR